MMKKIIIPLLSILIFPFNTQAGIDEAKSAYLEKNYAQAIRELKPLAEQGDSFAQFALAKMFKDGEGTPINGQQAVFWYTKAAEQGETGAQFNLGVIYYNGKVVKENVVLGYALVATAAANGDKLAEEFVKQLGGGFPGKISGDQIQQAHKLSLQLLVSNNYTKTIDNFFSAQKISEPARTVSDNKGSKPGSATIEKPVSAEITNSSQIFRLFAASVAAPSSPGWELLEKSEVKVAFIFRRDDSNRNAQVTFFKYLPPHDHNGMLNELKRNMPSHLQLARR